MELLHSASLATTESASMWDERMDVDKTLSTFSKLTRLRLALEVLFPSVYAFCALVWTVVWKVLHP
jgi:hypothetical protein